MDSNECWPLSDDKSQNYLRNLIEQAREAKVRLIKENDGRRKRNDWNRDFSRILYSTSFRRLQGKMQLLGIDPENFFRNRLTHSLEVSQIARSIAVETGVYDANDQEFQVVQAAALAHDIGNPPFGHCGEAILNEITQQHGGFEGNAQTLRILMQLEKKNPEHGGLNLTLRTLLAVTKYFVKRETGVEKKFIYDDDYQQLSEKIESCKIDPRTIDVQIMDLADDIAYAAHDLEDALSMKLFGLDEFLFEFKCWVKKNDKNEQACETLDEMIETAIDFAYESRNSASPEKYNFLIRKELTGLLVHALINDIGVRTVDQAYTRLTGTKHIRELGFCKLGDLAEGLKKVTFACINKTPQVQLYERRAEQIIQDLFHVLINPELNKNFLLLPPEYRPSNSKKKCLIYRSVVDYVAGMMDTFAIALHKKFVGDKPLFDSELCKHPEHIDSESCNGLL